MPLVNPSAVGADYDLVVVGTGFGSLFFVEKTLQLDPKMRVLMLEWGTWKSHEHQIAEHSNADVQHTSTFENVENAHKKPWIFTIGVGGGTNCWVADTPRMLPGDFATYSRFGVGQDWPISYEDLEPYYCEAEEVMQIAGSDDNSRLFPRSRPFPQPPHRFSTPDEIMKRAQPDRHFALPAARARAATKTRNPCCAAGHCSFCPSNAKFTVENGFAELIANPQVTIAAGARVTQLVRERGIITRVRYRTATGEREVRGDLFVLGANAIHSPAILQASGMDTPLTGAGLSNDMRYIVEVFLDGVDNFDGGTKTTGINYSLTDDAWRKKQAPVTFNFENRWMFGLRKEPGRWRQTLPIFFTIEDQPSRQKVVTLGADGTPHVAFAGYSDYAKRGLAAALKALPDVLKPLPVEAIHERETTPNGSHLVGSLKMGRSREDSVVDVNQVHHDASNLIVVGSSVFPTCPVSNPSLTVAALSLRAADRALAPQ
jgi:choline dehydrogenase-like flavoprotein